MATERGFQFVLPRVCKANFAKSLLSVPQILDAGIHILFRPTHVLFLKPSPDGVSKVVARARRRKNDFVIRLRVISTRLDLYVIE